MTGIENNTAPQFGIFPETFREFFCVVNDDEDRRENILGGGFLEDKTIPKSTNTNHRTEYRRRRRASMDRQRPSSPPLSPHQHHQQRQLGLVGLGRSNSYRKPNHNLGAECKHIRYCCLHRNQFFPNTSCDSKLITTSSTTTAYMSENECDDSLCGNISDDEKRLIKAENHKRYLFESKIIDENSVSNTVFDSDERSSIQTATSENCLRAVSAKFNFAGENTLMVGNLYHMQPETEHEAAAQCGMTARTYARKSSLAAVAATTDLPLFPLSMPRQSLYQPNITQNYPTFSVEHEIAEFADKFHSWDERNDESPAITPSIHQPQSIVDQNIIDRKSQTEKPKPRKRTSSMPVENRKPRLADTRRAAIPCADMNMEYYRLRSFSITSHGICNLGDLMRSRRSSVTSTGSNNDRGDRKNSNLSQAGICSESARAHVPTAAFKVAMLGETGVGKTALTYQFTTSDYICAYDLSLDDDYGQKTVSVMLDGAETDLEIIDHPASEMSPEAFCATYRIDCFVVVYSIVDRNSFKTAEGILRYLKDSEMLFTRAAILVGNKTDLERHRHVSLQAGRHLAKSLACKFIETSSGLNHNVDELLVGTVAQIKLNPKRIERLSEKDRLLLAASHPPGPLFTELQRRTFQECGLPSQSSCNDDEIENDRERFLQRRINRKRDFDSEPDLASEENHENEHKGISFRDHTNSESSSSSEAQSPQKQDAQTTSKDSKPPMKFSNRTKMFLASLIKFRKGLRVKRKNSSNCSDLFVI